MIKMAMKHAGRASHLRNWINGRPRWAIIGIAFGLCVLAGIFTASVTQPPYRIADSSVVDSIARQYALHDTTVFTDERMHPESIYLAAYPNNRFITYVLMLLYKVVSIVSTSESAFIGAATVMNIILGSAAVVVTSITIYRLTQRKIFGLIGYIVSAFLIALNPNLVIFYSDVPALLITAALLLTLVTVFRAKTATYRQIIALAALTVLGALVKPPSIIIVLALIGVVVISAIQKQPVFAVGLKKAGTFFGTIAFTAAVFGGAMALTPNFAKYTPQQIDQYRVDALHYFGMGSLRGLDPYSGCTMGTYCQAYVSDTVGVWGGQKPEFASEKARDRYAISLIKQSVSQDFPTGYPSFVARKLATAFFPTRAYYSENTAIWSHTLMWLHDNKAALHLRKAMYGDRGIYPVLVRVLSFVSAALVMVGFMRYLIGKRKDAGLLATLYLSLLLFVLYGTISEFRAAYVWPFIPILITLSVIGYLSLRRTPGAR